MADLETIMAVHQRANGHPMRQTVRRWLVPTMFTLEDGREVASNHLCETRHELETFIDSLPRDVLVPLHVIDVERTMAEMPLEGHDA